MTAFELDALLRQEADAFSGQCAYLVADAREPAPLHARLENEVFLAGEATTDFIETQMGDVL